MEGLPVELLIAIFVDSQTPYPTSCECCGRFPDSNKDEEEYKPPVPSLESLMLVCRRFRHVILATPTLWSRIPITGNVGTLKQRLSRSGDSPVDLVFK